MTIEALVFDLGGVIVAHDNPVMFERVLGRCTAPDAAARLHAAFAHDDFGTGARSIASLHAELEQTAGYAAGWDQFRADWSCHFTVDPAMLALVRSLAAERRVMLFSNTNAEHWEHLVQATGGALAEIEAHLSHEMGVVKPAPAAYLALAERAGIRPATSLFFDDRPENVEGARAAGFHAEVFTGQAALVRRLHAAGIAVPA